MAKHSLAFLVGIAFTAQPALAQMDAPPIPSALPGVAKISIANAAGVLNYCTKNYLVSSTAADQVLTVLSNKPDAKSSDYIAGQAGEVHGDDGKTFALASQPPVLQSQACDRVLQQAKTFK